MRTCGITVIQSNELILMYFLNYRCLRRARSIEYVHKPNRLSELLWRILWKTRASDVSLHACFKILYIHVTVHRNKFLFNNQPGALVIQIYSVIKLYMFSAYSRIVYFFIVLTFIYHGILLYILTTLYICIY